jgi:tripartite-type tricarboxylate transporter receptor subunit TctC
MKERRINLKRLTSLTSAFFTGSLTTRSGFAQAQTAQLWPVRPIKWIVSQPAGAGPDILARVIAEHIAKSLSQPVIIENKPGGQNVIGSLAAAKSPPDGYNFYYATTAAMVTNRFTFKSLPYDPEKDFVPVALIGRSPFVIAAANASGIASLADAIAQAKAQPEKIAIATEGPKTFSGMLASSFMSMAEVRLNQVPYTKATDAIADVIGGRVAMVCLPEAALISYIKNGQLRALAVSTAQRLSVLPNVPALSEAFKGFEYTGWNAIFAPVGTPSDVVSRVNKEVVAYLRQPDTIVRLASLGSLADAGMSPDEVGTFMLAEKERWAGIVKAIGIKPE